jgi:K+-sensing histidine kinase KdpD
MDLRRLRDAMRSAGREGLPPASARAYLFAVACVGVAALAHFALAQLSADIAPSILYNPAVFVAALIGGTRAGLIAAGASSILVWWTFDARYLGGPMNTLTPALNCALYISAAGVIIWVAARYRAFARHEQARAHDAAGAMGAGAAAASLPGRRPWWPPGVAPNSLAGYVVALAAIAIATLIRHGFGWFGGEMLPLVSYYPAVLLAALTGGAGAGLLAMLASLVVVWSEFPAPWISFGPITREESVGLALYVFASLLTVWLAENRRHAWRGDDLPQPAILQWATSILVAFAAVLLTTLVLLAVHSYLAPDHLVLGYLLPTVVIAMHYGSTLAVITSFAGGIAATYFLFPPKFGFFIADPLGVGELGFFLLLAVIASKAVAVFTDDIRARNSRHVRRHSGARPEGREPGIQ